ncbi:MAG: hypothetical protein GF401_11180 [Chitinivibrionales bacterium]|nr:hypothetical protein [Chitinivibrionales bacterium]
MEKGFIYSGILVGICSVFVSAQPVARVGALEGKAGMLRKGSENWRNVRPNMPLKVGDQLYTQPESFVEIRYSKGQILRMDESTKITIEESSEKTTKTKSSIGRIWVNMKKMVTQGDEFQVATPTAVAAIRGTVFNINTDKDSSTSVDVYDGKVAVGPADRLKKKKKKTQPSTGVTEIPGPEEIPGPYEVPLETWKTIVAGQRISVNKDGKFAQEQFDIDTSAKNDFVKKNMALDKKEAEQ